MSKKIFLGLVAIVVVIAGVSYWWSNSGGVGGAAGTAEGMAGDPLDLTVNFYQDWLDAAQATSTDPFSANILQTDFISAALRERLEASHILTPTAEVDPVLCQTVPPEKIRAKAIFQADDSAQVMVLPGSKEIQAQAQVTLEAREGLWQIVDISCSNGETAPETEFDFERQGYLLKSVPPPLDSQYWHIVFEQNGVLGHTVPLFFSDTSECIAADGSASICHPDQFTEATAVTAAGSMTEAGLEVQRLDFSN